MSVPDDRSGVARRCGGPPEDSLDPRPSFDEVAERYGRKIYNVAYRLTGNPEDAADLTQDVFVRVLRNLHRYHPGTFDGWLYRITKNLFLDQVRRRRRLKVEPLTDEEWRAPRSQEPTPADVIERRTLEARLEHGLARLPEDFRLAVVLCDVEGLSYEQIAEATGWPMGTVRSRIHRGRKRLRDFLEQGGGRASKGPPGSPAGEAEGAGGGTVSRYRTDE
ncbi:MAG: sigma-70 family RNA polymerase sigma factor [Actinomycetota bacterium]|nr:sigma-70 family RNA polymerase sigma factor [Actinomycetota bacterium]